MRTKNSILNVIVGMLSYVLLTLCSFATRRILYNSVGLGILGVNGVFSSIISMLSLTELGVGTAIIYNLYGTLAENNEEQTIALMQLYSKIYKIIAVVVTSLGIVILPFLKYFIKEDINQGLLILIFILMLADVVISYLFAYKRAIIIASQKGFVITIVTTSVSVVLNVIQIVGLLLTQNYILYLIIKIVFRLIENFIIAKIANRMYSYICTKEKYDLNENIKKNIIKNVKAVALHFIGIYMINGVDNIIISGIIGVVASGIYSNYSLILNTLRSFMLQLTQGILPSFGNLLVESDIEKSQKVFYNAMFINFVLVNFISISILVTINPFVRLWISGTALLSSEVVLILVINFYIVGISEMLGSLRASAGLYGPDKYLHVFLALLNLIISVLLTKVMGIAGVFLGTLICHIIKEIIVLPKIVFKYIFKTSSLIYYKKLIIYIISTIFFGLVTVEVGSLFSMSNLFLDIAMKVIICVIVPNALTFICYKRTREFKYCVSLASSVKKSIINKSNSKVK